MFGGGWSSQGMITSLRNNKKLLRRKNMFKNSDSFLNLRSEYFKRTEGRILSTSASKEVLEKIRKDFIKKQKINIAITVSAILITISIFGLIFYCIAKNEKKIKQNNFHISNQKKEKNYLRFIDEGDIWFKKRHWYNAIYKYKEAQVLYPKDFEINYRLIQAYSYRCKYDLKDCYEAKSLLEKLLKEFPEKNELHKFKNILDIEFSSSLKNK